MSRCRGGSWDDILYSGEPWTRRLTVLPHRTIPDAFETYIRDETGEWVFAHDGPKRPEDGDWNAPGV